jgi:salicylate hydroxylase
VIRKAVIKYASEPFLDAYLHAKVNHLTSRWARLKRDVAYAWRKLIKPSSHTYQVEWIYGYDVTKD